MEFTAKVQVDGWTFMPRFEFDRLDADAAGEFTVAGLDFPVFAEGRGGFDQAQARAVSAAASFANYVLRAGSIACRWVRQVSAAASFANYVLSGESAERAREYFDALGVSASLTEGQLVAQANA